VIVGVSGIWGGKFEYRISKLEGNTKFEEGEKFESAVGRVLNHRTERGRNGLGEALVGLVAKVIHPV
jgi:hypothetical protein